MNGIHLKGWKKVHDGGDHTVMQSMHGHEMVIQHKPLTKKMREGLQALPLHERKQSKKLKATERLDEKPQMFDNGGDVRRIPDAAKSIPSSLPGANDKPNTPTPTETGHGTRDPDATTKLNAQNSYTPAPEIPGAPHHKFAQGGIAGNPKLEESRKLPPPAPMMMADGGIDISANSQEAPQFGVEPDTVAPNPALQEFEQKRKAADMMLPPVPAPGFQNREQEVDAQALNQMENEKRLAEEKVEATKHAEAAKALQTREIESQQAAQRAKLGLPSGATSAPISQPQASNSMPSSLPAQAPSAATPQQPQDPYGYAGQQEMTETGLGMQLEGQAAQARAEGTQAKDQYNAEKAAVTNQQNAMNAYQAHLNELNGMRDQALKAVQEQHIDPNHWWGSRDTGGKILGAIGMILGGGAAGVLGTKNPIQTLIDRDIDAQKAELGRKENLLAANLHMFGDLRMATEMTRVMQADITAHQMHMAALKAVDPMAKARLMQASGQLIQQNAPTLQKMAMVRTLMTGAANGAIDPAMAIRAVAPPDEQGPLFKELKEAQDAYRARDNVLGAFDKVAKLNTAGSRIGSPFQSQSQIDAAWGPVVAGLSKETAGRFTEQDMQQLDHLKPLLRDDAKTVASKRANLLQLVQQKMNFPHLASYKLDNAVAGKSLYDQQGRSRLTISPRTR